MTNISNKREEMIKNFLQEERQKDNQIDDEDILNEEDEHLMLAQENNSDEMHEEDDGVLISWEGPEFETYKRDKQWYITAALVLLLIIAYAVIINSPIMAITFILIGVVGYIYLQKDPRHLVFSVTHEGIIVGNELYHFDDIESFWIFYEPPHTHMLSLHSKNGMLPYIHIPLHQVDTIELQKVLVLFAHEEKQEMNVVDTIERLLHI